MTLEEYLVKLGWQIDDPSYKKFLGALSSTSAKTAELGAVVVETAAAIELMVSRVARKYETLYYVSQRTGQSVKYIQSTQFAFKQIGLSADEANASIEGIAATLRTQPWLRSLFGGASTPQEVASRLGKSGMPYFLQTRFAEMIGMDEKTLFHLQKFGAIEADAQKDFEARQRAAGINPKQLSEQAVALGRAINKLESDIEIWGERFAVNFIEPITKGVDALDHVVQWLNRADVATHGWLSTLEALAGTAGSLWLLEKVLVRIGGVLGITSAAGAAATAGGAAVAGGAVSGGGAAAVAGGSLALPLTGVGAAVYGAYKANQTYGGIFQPSTFSGKGGSSDQATKIVQAVEFFQKNGFPMEAAIGIVSGLHSESKLDETSVNSIGMSGIGQWDTKRRADFAKLYGKDLRTTSFEDQLRFVLWELNNTEGATGTALKKGGMTGRQAASTFIHGFERPGVAGEASDMSRAGPLADALSSQAANTTNNTGGNTVSITNQTTIHASDTKEAASLFDRSAANNTGMTLGILRNAGVVSR